MVLGNCGHSKKNNLLECAPIFLIVNRGILVAKLTQVGISEEKPFANGVGWFSDSELIWQNF